MDQAKRKFVVHVRRRDGRGRPGTMDIHLGTAATAITRRRPLCRVAADAAEYVLGESAVIVAVEELDAAGEVVDRFDPAAPEPVPAGNEDPEGAEDR